MSKQALRLAQQPLHPVRSGLAGMFGDPPRVLTLQPGHEPGHILPDPFTRIRPGETRTNPTINDANSALQRAGLTFAMPGQRVTLAVGNAQCSSSIRAHFKLSVVDEVLLFQ
jgi:hypothetical protein